MNIKKLQEARLRALFAGAENLAKINEVVRKVLSCRHAVIETAIYHAESVRNSPDPDNSTPDYALACADNFIAAHITPD